MFPADETVKKMLVLMTVTIIKSEHLPRNLKVYSPPLRQSKSHLNAITSRLWGHCPSHALFFCSQEPFKYFGVQWGTTDMMLEKTAQGAWHPELRMMVKTAPGHQAEGGTPDTLPFPWTLPLASSSAWYALLSKWLVFSWVCAPQLFPVRVIRRWNVHRV